MMSDWLSKLEEQRRQEDAAQRAQAEREQNALSEDHRQIQHSYEQNKTRYEQIYDSIERYTRRASGMGFKVRAERQGGCMFIFGSHSDAAGDNFSATLELRPWGNGFWVHYKERAFTSKRISLNRITDQVIADWVKWVAFEGPHDPVEEGRIRIFLWIIGVGIGLLILAGVIAFIVSR